MARGLAHLSDEALVALVARADEDALAELYDRFNRVDQAIDAIAIEVERIGEGQRYLTRSIAEQQRALGAGAAEPVRASEREPDRQIQR